jgi:murein L,D-transpeptidase YcbB/YkuD
LVDPATRLALNTPVDERIGQIVANMERWRWLPAQLPADRIQVNIAAAVLTVFRGDTATMSMRAVTGKPGDETPMLSSVVHSVVLNPPWNVPTGIAANELIPKGRAYLARNGFSMIPTGGGGYRLQQKAGPQSALGRMKFDFDNPFAVYLHDTPTRSTFERYGRLASHGCVRLEKAEQLTRALLEGDPVWTPAAIDQTLATGQTVRAPLSRPVSVFLLYWTAYLAPDGQMNFRADPYGWDRELLKRIDGAPV